MPYLVKMAPGTSKPLAALLLDFPLPSEPVSASEELVPESQALVLGAGPALPSPRLLSPYGQ